MDLHTYLRRNGESQTAFGRRVGLPQVTVSRICAGSGCRAATALLIIEATGGLVTLRDLTGEQPKSGAA